MRRALFVVAAILLVGCGGASPVATPTVAISPTPSGPSAASLSATATDVAAQAFNVAVQATVTRAAELSQNATIAAQAVSPSATPMPTMQIGRASLEPGAVATVPGILRVTVQNAQESPPLRTVVVILRIDNLTATDLLFTPCSFLLRDASAQDTTALACDQNVPVSQGSLLVASGGNLVVNLKFPYDPKIDLMWLRFTPVQPTNARIYLGNSSAKDT